MNVRPGGEVDLDIILPGTWYWIPVDDGEEIRKQCRLIIRRQLGVSDRLASRRREVAEQLVAAAKDAKAAGAVSFAMALELAPGVPFPASLMMNFSDWPTASTGDVDSRLRAAFPSAEILDQRTGPVARVAEFFQQRVDEEATPTLRCEYWLPVLDGTRLLGVTISAPTMPDPDLFTRLFDSIVDSITFSRDLIAAETVD